MDIRLELVLTAEEVKQAIKEYAVKKIDLGVPFCDDDITLGRLSTSEGYLTITKLQPYPLAVQQDDDLPF